MTVPHPDEQRVVRLLVARGLVDEETVARFAGDLESEDGAATHRTVLTQLVGRGLVDEAAVRQAEVDIGDPTGPVTEPAADGAAADGAAAGDIPPELARWDRYRVARLLGRGGAGAVYLARDARLERLVAVKVLASGSETALREARLQARVGHDGVCKVFEAGWVEGRPFVAMQYVDGETLERAAPHMTREGIVTAVRDAALAIHAAHGIGLVHRDIKPGNIMIERRPGESDRTYVLDFGLAKEVAAEGATVQGSLLGTPAFMAPEQARGDIRRIDRRTDVYGLGATLYDALCGAPPFEGRAAALLTAVLNDEPIALRKRDATLSEDLEAIVHRCLEKNPTARYPSARALADDLDRYLRGDPVEARRPGVLSRLVRRARRHRAAAAVALGAAVLLSVVGAAWIRDRIEARQRAETMRDLAREAEAVESAMRLARLAPLHDVRRTRLGVAARLAELESTMAARDALAEGLLHETLGRGYLSLRDHERARVHLDRAWQLGERGPALSFALARAYGALYELGLNEVRRIADPAEREARRAALDAELRAPALARLRATTWPAEDRPHLLEGYFAFLEGRSADAIAHARSAAEALPWLYEARELMGDVHAALGREAERRGEHDVALAEYGAAARLYDEAAEIGRSDAAVHEAECRVRHWAMEVEIRFLRAPLDEVGMAAALAACARSIAADPDPPHGWEHTAELLLLRADAAAARGGDPAPDLDETIRIAEDLRLVHPDRALGHALLGHALSKQAAQDAARGNDTRAQLARAIEAGETAVALDPGLRTTHNQLGMTYRALAEQEMRRGEDPRPAVRRAVESYERAAVLDPHFTGAWNNVGRAHAVAAEYEIFHGLPAAASLAAGAGAYRRAAAEVDGTPVIPNNEGLLLSLAAMDARLRGEDPEPLLARAEAAFDASIALRAQYAFAWKNRGYVRAMRAEHALVSGGDPRPHVALAVRDYETALRHNPRYAGAHRGLAAALLVEARYTRSGEGAGGPLARARAALDRALEIAPGDAETHLGIAELSLCAARLARDPAPHLAAADAAVRAVAAAGRTAADVHVVAAEVHLGSARAAGARAAEAAGHVEAGLAEVDRALAVNPRSAEAHAVRGALLLARATIDAEGRERALADSEYSLNKAREIDRLSAFRIRELLDEEAGAAR